MEKPSDRNKLFAPFLEDIITYEDLVFLIDELRKIKSYLYKTEGRFLSDKISGKVSEKIAKIISNYEKNKILPLSTSQIDDFFESLINYLKKIPKISFTLAFSPRRDFLKYLKVWCQQNVTGRIVLNILIRREVIAGVIVEYNGKYMDFSKAHEVDTALIR